VGLYHLYQGCPGVKESDMSFYNPYLNKPDIGQGIQGIIQSIMPLLMMSKMFPGQQGPSPEQNALGQSAQVGMASPEAMGGMQGPPPMGPGGPGATPGMGAPVPGGPGGMPNIPPGLIQMIMQMLMKGGGPPQGGGMPPMGGRPPMGGGMPPMGGGM
jgi:hypothetical protein